MGEGNWMVFWNILLITDKPGAEPADAGQQASQAKHSGCLMNPSTMCPIRAQLPSQVSTRISTAWSSSPRSDLQLELGGGVVAEEKAWSPLPWPDWVLPTIPVSTASRS